MICVGAPVADQPLGNLQIDLERIRGPSAGQLRPSIRKESSTQRRSEIRWGSVPGVRFYLRQVENVVEQQQ